MTAESIASHARVMAEVGRAIKDLGRVPSGILYAQLAPVMDYITYQSLIEALKKTGLVREENHVLIWNEKEAA